MSDRVLIELMNSRKESINDFEKSLLKFETIQIELKNKILKYVQQETQKCPKSEDEKKLTRLDINIQELRLNLSEHYLTSNREQLEYMKDNVELVDLMILFLNMLPDINNNEKVIKKLDNLRKRIEPRWDLLEQTMDKAIINFEKHNVDPNGI